MSKARKHISLTSNSELSSPKIVNSSPPQPKIAAEDITTPIADTTDQAVADIIKYEDDELIALEDAQRNALPSQPYHHKLAKWKLWLLVLIVVGLIAALALHHAH